MRNSLRRFLSDECGAISPLILVLFVGLLLTTGIALDLLRHEAERADLHAALDRGVLAATSLTQTIDTEAVVQSYVDIGVPNAAASVDVTESAGLGWRRVDATANHQIDTIFLNMVGLSALDVGVETAAAQGLTGVEISMVLDISGTMRWNNRLPNLKIAANGFIDQVTENGTSEVTTISIVPYAGQVNPGPWMFNHLGGVRGHTESSCFEFTGTDFGDVGLPSTGTYAQVPHFHHWAIDWGWMDWGWCPSDDAAITYLSNDAAALKNTINTIRLHDGTGTYNAMKWGLSLLDPVSQPTVFQLAAQGLVDPVYATRPSSWDDPESLKFIVLMTDGQITQQNRPQHPGDPELATEEVLVFGHPWHQIMSRSTGLQHFYNLCDLAKANGVIVFTIAFEAPSAAKTEMRNCASSVSHFYDVNGLEIADAFAEIGSTIQSLKLVK